ncbi:MAG: BON domain-containing protein [Pirellulaceae bacterium]|nr:BON domain-containing protein [Pirellulaceae bacterium]
MADTEAARIPEQVQTALHSSPIYALRELQVEQDAETIIISGRVETYYHKQLAQEIVRTVLNGRELVNAIHVDYVS